MFFLDILFNLKQWGVTVFQFLLKIFVVQEEKGTCRTCDVHFFGVPRFYKQTLEAANLPHVTYTAKCTFVDPMAEACWIFSKGVVQIL